MQYRKHLIHCSNRLCLISPETCKRQQCFSIILHKFINLKTGPMCIVWLISEMLNILHVSVKSFLRTNKIIKALKLCKHIKVFESFCCEYFLFEMFLIYRFACTLFMLFAQCVFSVWLLRFSLRFTGNSNLGKCAVDCNNNNNNNENKNSKSSNNKNNIHSDIHIHDGTKRD